MSIDVYEGPTTTTQQTSSWTKDGGYSSSSQSWVSLKSKSHKEVAQVDDGMQSVAAVLTITLVLSFAAFVYSCYKKKTVKVMEEEPVMKEDGFVQVNTEKITFMEKNSA